jgi:DNA-binding NarL/FixJ family response regulator
MNARQPITVAVTRFEDLLALGLNAALGGDPSVELVVQDIAPAHLDATLRAHRPAVLIADVGTLRDLAQVRELALEHPETRLVLLGNRLSSIESAQLLAFGASACLAFDTETRDLRNAIHLASRGLQLQPMPGGEQHAPGREALLTPREGEVLGLLRQNQSNAQIALTLQIGIETVRSHARSIYRKLGVSSRRSLLALPGAAVESAT